MGDEAQVQFDFSKRFGIPDSSNKVDIYSVSDTGRDEEVSGSDMSFLDTILANMKKNHSQFYHEKFSDDNLSKKNSYENGTRQNEFLEAIVKHNNKKKLDSPVNSPIRGRSRGVSPVLAESVSSLKYGEKRDNYIYYTMHEFDMIEINEDDYSHLSFKVKNALKEHMSPFILNKSVNAWRGMTEKIDSGVKISSEDKFNYKTISLLNRLSLLSFNKLFGEFTKMDFDNNENIDKFMIQLYKKAQLEEAYCYLYVNLVYRSFRTFENKIIDGVSFKSYVLKLFKRLVAESLARDEVEEKAIKELKDFRTNEEDKLDEVINELEERESSYRKTRFGALTFLSGLLYFNCIDDEYILELLNNLKKRVDAFGSQLLVFALQTFGDLVYRKEGFKELYDTSLDELSKIASTFRFELKFAIIDTIKMKTEGFKTKAPRKTISDTSDTSVSFSKPLMNTPKTNLYNMDRKMSRGSRFSAGRRDRAVGRNQRPLPMGNKFSSLTRKHVEKEPEQPREMRPVQFYKPLSPPIIKEVETKKPEFDLNIFISDLLNTEFNIDEVMFQLRDLLIGKYALEFCKIGMKSILDLKLMHVSFGILISRLVSTTPEFKNCISEAIKYVLEELPSNGMDEPVLWVRFYRLMIPILESNCISLDDFSKILQDHEEISNSKSIIADIFSTCLKEFTYYHLLSIIRSNQSSVVLKDVLDSKSEFKEIIGIQMKDVRLFGLANFFNTSIENAQLHKEIKYLYSINGNQKDLVLKDLARITYINCLSGDEFNSTLGGILLKREKNFFEGIFFESAGTEFCKYFCECLVRFNSKYELLSLIGVAGCKSGLVNVGCLEKCISIFPTIPKEKLEAQISSIPSQLKQ